MGAPASPDGASPVGKEPPLTPPSRWARLARLPEPAQRGLQVRALARHVREELDAFSPAFRRARAEAGLRLDELVAPAAFARLPSLTREDLARDGRAHLLCLEPGGMRRNWPAARKLALGLGGRRVRAALPRSYRPALRLETRGRSAEPLGVWLTAFDLEIARELGRRNLEVLGLVPHASRAVALLGGASDLASWQVREALQAAAIPTALAPPPRRSGVAAALRAVRALAPTVLFGMPWDLLRLARAARRTEVALGALEVAVLLGEPAGVALRWRLAEELRAAGAPDPVRLAAGYGLAELRSLYFECPTPPEAPSGLHLFPDTVLAQVEGGDGRGPELVVTPLVGHGTAVFRYRTGDRVPGPPSWSRCPACGRGLPRVGPVGGRLDEDVDLGDGARLDFAALRAWLDGRPELLEWQLALRRPGAAGVGPAPGLVLRVATDAAGDGREWRRELADTLPVHGLARSDGGWSGLEIAAHSEQEMLDFLATPHPMLERRLLDPVPTA